MNQFSNTKSKTGLLPILEHGQLPRGSSFAQLMAGLSTPERKKLAVQTASLNQSGSEESLGINTYINDDDSDGKDKIFINDHNLKLPTNLKVKNKSKRQGLP